MSDRNPGQGTSSSTSSSSAAINKRPRLLSFQGPSDHAPVDGAPMAAGPSSSSLEEINARPAGRHPEMAPDLASWQEAQIAACIEDNTINLVLEQYLSFFEARHNGVEEAEMMVQAQAAELEHEQEVENRAIMAAINERGLQPAAVAIEEDVAEPELVPVPAMDVDPQQQQGQGIDLLESAVVAAIQEKGLQIGGQMEEDDGDIDGSYILL
ncbi:hypothetical protein pipiens_009084 [Culex pipiens pipiens]|uniref:Uncharacterized protein n=2 Tax=Culex pipiens TaxID=7175 RepID=A0ABD1DFA9_CULPP